MHTTDTGRLKSAASPASPGSRNSRDACAPSAGSAANSRESCASTSCFERCPPASKVPSCSASRASENHWRRAQATPRQNKAAAASLAGDSEASLSADLAS
eukprot:TRINITY_DN62989_c0_g1_i1.p1 TRINITY_DN62989_c0_g1~~TRINITY_DN62989_c0_g1_i1.p1  ORF type:complete len:101 (+),score=6.08 TRINITY_DN62989_c0_g1_i1:256-558(+)